MLASRRFGSAQNPTGKNIVNLCYRALVIAAVVIAALAWLAYFILMPSDASITTDSESYYPGDVISIRLVSGKKLLSSEIYFCGRKSRFFELEKKDNFWIYRGLASVPMDKKPGQATLEFSTVFSIWQNNKYSRTVNILAKTFKKRFFGSSLVNKDYRKAIAIARALKEESMVIRQLLSEATEIKLWKDRFIIPVNGRLTSPYGQIRLFGKNKPAARHKGVDIAAWRGTPVIAPNNGKVRITAKFKGTGNTVLLDHGQGVYSIYMHLRRIKVKRNDTVEKGTLLGTVGSTGQSTGSHLHWGVYVNGNAVDPFQWTEKNIY
jgi:murein DD-endopeptidase MepM/ murein hydrolase activator NlpD